ncbi:hypothetical protein [Streptomyces microflavus]
MPRKDRESAPPQHLPGHPLPGIKYEPELRKRIVIHAVDGDPEEVEEDYRVWVPAMPRDWDHTLLTGATGVAVALLTVAVAWSVASIGDLLNRAVTAPIAYLAAGVFALAWIVCLALQWLARYDPERAASVQKAGNVFLALDMAAVAAHGNLVANIWVGLAGAAVSGVAKFMWSIVMRQHSRPLPELTRRWLAKKEGDLTARLAIAGQLRTLARAEAQAAVYAAPAPAAIERDSQQDTAGQLSPTVLSAVRAVLATLPDLSHDDVLLHLDRLGLAYDETAVLAVLDNEQDNQDSRSKGGPSPLFPPTHTVTESVRTALSSGIRDKGQVVSYVHKIHGSGVPKATIVRLFNREQEKAG